MHVAFEVERQGDRRSPSAVESPDDRCARIGILADDEARAVGAVGLVAGRYGARTRVEVVAELHPWAVPRVGAVGSVVHARRSELVSVLPRGGSGTGQRSQHAECQPSERACSDGLSCSVPPERQASASRHHVVPTRRSAHSSLSLSTAASGSEKVKTVNAPSRRYSREPPISIARDRAMLRPSPTLPASSALRPS